MASLRELRGVVPDHDGPVCGALSHPACAARVVRVSRVHASQRGRASHVARGRSADGLRGVAALHGSRVHWGGYAQARLFREPLLLVAAPRGVWVGCGIQNQRYGVSCRRHGLLHCAWRRPPLPVRGLHQVSG